MKENNNTYLIIAIIFAGLAISGSIFYSAVQANTSAGEDEISQSDIEKAIEDYVAKQQETGDQANGDANPTIIEGDYSDDDPYMGDASAPVTMIEFSDYQCPYCRSFYNSTFPQIKENYIDTGKVKFVYRDFPLNFHKDSFPASLAAECVRDQGGDELYFEMNDKIFEGQSLLGAGTVEIPEKALITYAEDLKVDMDEFNDCVESEKFKEEIYKDLNDGQNIGISGTPGFLINGQIVSGAQPYSVFENIFEENLGNN